MSDDDVLTLERIRLLRDDLRAKAIPPKTIETEEKARELTASDPFGRKWRVGDQYYEFPRLS